MHGAVLRRIRARQQDGSQFSFETDPYLIDFPLPEQFLQNVIGMARILFKCRKKEVVHRHFGRTAAASLVASGFKNRFQFLCLLNLHGVFLD